MSEHNQKFDSKVEWINKAQSWLTRHPRYGQFFKAICFDGNGMICLNGGHFAKAAYPVYWVWPDQNLFSKVKEVLSGSDEILHLNEFANEKITALEAKLKEAEQEVLLLRQLSQVVDCHSLKCPYEAKADALEAKVNELELALYRINQCSLEPDKILCIYERAVPLKRRMELKGIENIPRKPEPPKCCSINKNTNICSTHGVKHGWI